MSTFTYYPMISDTLNHQKRPEEPQLQSQLQSQLQPQPKPVQPYPHQYQYMHHNLSDSIIANCPTPSIADDQLLDKNNFQTLQSMRKSNSSPNNYFSSVTTVSAKNASISATTATAAVPAGTAGTPRVPGMMAASKTSSFESQLPSQQPLSPPLSPYQRNAELHTLGGNIHHQSEILKLHQVLQSPLPTTTITTETTASSPPPKPKPFLDSSKNYKLENFRDYKLTISVKPSKSYYAHQFEFLDKYSSIASAEHKTNNAASLHMPVRKYKKRSYLGNYDSNDESYESGATAGATAGVRTRRLAKTKEIFDNSDTDVATPVKKRKRVATPSNFGHTPSHLSTPSSPSMSIAMQQQLLIDESIPDFSPDAQATLPNNAKCLKIEWKGQPMDLTNDPNLTKYKLHPAEIHLASILRLPVAVYMDSKRRFFFEKVQKIKAGKMFRRTDAQKACRIDVNKASRLFAAFEKVGWLNDKLFEKYL